MPCCQGWLTAAQSVPAHRCVTSDCSATDARFWPHAHFTSDSLLHCPKLKEPPPSHSHNIKNFITLIICRQRWHRKAPSHPSRGSRGLQISTIRLLPVQICTRPLWSHSDSTGWKACDSAMRRLLTNEGTAQTLPVKQRTDDAPQKAGESGTWSYPFFQLVFFGLLHS